MFTIDTYIKNILYLFKKKKKAFYKYLNTHTNRLHVCIYLFYTFVGFDKKSVSVCIDEN